MRSKHQAFFASILFLALFSCLLAWLCRAPRAPAVRVTFLGYVPSSGLTVFSITNTSPSTIYYSGHYRIQLMADGGWTNLPEAFHPQERMIKSGEDQAITLPAPDGEKEWRVEVDIFAGGYDDGKTRQFVRQLGRAVGWSFFQPVRYPQRSDVVTKHLEEIVGIHRKPEPDLAPTAITP